MSEYVQALELRISDNAQEAARGLTKLADAFRAIKKNIGRGFGTGLEKAATQLTTFNQQISSVTSNDNISKLDRLASALERICNATRGMSSVRGLTNAVRQTVSGGAGGARSAGIANAGQTVQEVADATENVKSSIRNFRSEFESLGQAGTNVRRLANSVKETGHVTKFTPLVHDLRKDFEELGNASGKVRRLANSVREVGHATKYVRTGRYWMNNPPSTVEPRERFAPDPAEVARKRAERIGRTASLERRGVDLEARSGGRIRELREELEQYAASTARATGAEQVRASEVMEAAQAQGQEVAATNQAVGANNRLRESVEKLNRAKDAVKNFVSGAASELRRFKSAIFDANGSLFGFLSGMMRIAKYRIFRSLIKEISEGFKTGLENVREYSKAINGLYAKEMQGLDNSLLKMKNSLGAAVAPAIQALIPVFQTLTQWVITASNYINQFFALINGASTWTRAIDVQADAIEESGNKAGGAAKKVNNLLAAWDELNIIQSESGGGGGGGSKKNEIDYTKMFEEVDAFDGKVRDLVEFLKNNMPIVESLLAGVGAKLLGLRFPAAITITGLVFSFEQGRTSGKSNIDFTQAMKDSLPGMIGTAIGGAAVGFSAAPPGQKIKGALIGFTVGAAVSLAASTLGWIVGQEDAGVNTTTFTDFLEEDLVNLVGITLGATGAGVLIGSAVGHPVTGAAIGFTVGAALSLAATAVDWKNRGTDEIEVAETFAEHLANNISGVLGTVVAGASFGFMAGGAHGALIGATIGLLASVVLSKVEYNAKKSKLKERLQWGPVSLEAAKIKQWVNSLFSIDVDAYVNVRNSIVTGIEERKAQIQSMVTRLAGKYSAMVSVGIQKASPDDIESLKSDVDGVISELNSHLNDVKALIGIMITDDISYMGGANGEIFTDTLDNITGIQEYITGLGNEIGKILSDGVVEEFEKDTLDGLMKSLSDVTNAITLGKEVGASVAEIKRGADKLKSSDYTKDTIEEFASTYATQEKAVQEAAYNSARTAQENMFGLAYAMKASGQYSQEQIDKAFADANAFNVDLWVKNQVEQIMAPASSIFVETLKESIGSAAAKWSYTSGNPIPDYIQDYYKIRKDNNPNAEANNAYEYFTKTPGEMTNLLGYFITKTTGVNWDTLSAYHGAGGNIADLLPEWIMNQIFYNFSNAGYKNAILGTSPFARYWTDEPASNMPVITPEVQEYLDEIERQWNGGNTGRAPTGTVMANAGFMSSGVSYGTYVQTNNGIVNADGAPGIDTEDDDDPQTEETNRLLRNILEGVTNIRNKRFTAEIVANANTGRLMRTAISQAERVYGI